MSSIKSFLSIVEHFVTKEDVKEYLRKSMEMNPEEIHEEVENIFASKSTISKYFTPYKSEVTQKDTTNEVFPLKDNTPEQKGSQTPNKEHVIDLLNILYNDFLMDMEDVSKRDQEELDKERITMYEVCVIACVAIATVFEKCSVDVCFINGFPCLNVGAGFVSQLSFYYSRSDLSMSYHYADNKEEGMKGEIQSLNIDTKEAVEPVVSIIYSLKDEGTAVCNVVFGWVNKNKMTK